MILLIYSFLSFQGKTPACSCVDCQESCPAPPPLPPAPEPFTVLNYDGYAVIMFIVFLSGVAIFVVFLVCFDNRKKIGESREYLRQFQF